MSIFCKKILKFLIERLPLLLLHKVSKYQKKKLFLSNSQKKSVVKMFDITCDPLLYYSIPVLILYKSSRGGLGVECWSDNRLDSAMVD